jgi:hypothetical protein
MSRHGPAITCHRHTFPPDTATRKMIGDQDGETVRGWLVRRPSWPRGIWHLSACERGVVHLVGYITDPLLALPALDQWRENRRGNAHEWERDGV